MNDQLPSLPTSLADLIAQEFQRGGSPGGLDVSGGYAWGPQPGQISPPNAQARYRLNLPTAPGFQPFVDVTGGYGWGQGPQPRQPLGAGNLGVRFGIKVPF